MLGVVAGELWGERWGCVSAGGLEGAAGKRNSASNERISERGLAWGESE